jgi:3-oxoacyl-[acyl-carrier protein] reductase
MKKIALITGGSRGIGKAITLQLAKSGYSVLINYHTNLQSAEETLTEVIHAGGEGELFQCNVGDLKEVSEAFAKWKIHNEDKTISVLINNAGIRKDNLFVWIEPEQWDSVLNTNLNSFYYVTKQVIQDMILNKFGRIVNIVSLSGIKGMPGQVNYSAAKAGVIGATKALAQEVGRKNITVNAVAPGFIKTDMTRDLDELNLKKLVPLNRFGEAEEVADLVSFLISDKAGYITGETISINGGLYT